VLNFLVVYRLIHNSYSANSLPKNHRSIIRVH